MAETWNKRFQTMELLDCLQAAGAALESGAPYEAARRAGIRALARFRPEVRATMLARYDRAWKEMILE